MEVLNQNSQTISEVSESADFGDTGGLVAEDGREWIFVRVEEEFPIRAGLAWSFRDF